MNMNASELILNHAFTMLQVIKKNHYKSVIPYLRFAKRIIYMRHYSKETYGELGCGRLFYCKRYVSFILYIKWNLRWLELEPWLAEWPCITDPNVPRISKIVICDENNNSKKRWRTPRKRGSYYMLKNEQTNYFDLKYLSYK